MVNIFLDTNIFFDVISRNKVKAKLLNNNKAYISPLSCHIYYYSEQVKVPDEKINDFLNNLNIVNLSSKILKQAMEGPTGDLEDNIQLHSALGAECQYFLTNDKNLLNLRVFGKTKIVSKI